jgi:hypothetical protein
MASRIQTVTLLPALFLFVLSGCFALLTFRVVVFSVKQGLLTLASTLFVGGLVLSLRWGYSWILSRRLQESKSFLVSRVLSRSRMIGFFLTAVGVITLIWVGHLIWHDTTVWGKDLALIFFGSRTGENIDLGIGMIVIHYFLAGLTLLFFGSVMSLYGLRKCPHYFGYLASRHKGGPIPLRCLDCSLAADCVMIKRRQTRATH